MELMEELLTEVFKCALPHVSPPTRPFPIMPYRQAIDEVRCFHTCTCCYNVLDGMCSLTRVRMQRVIVVGLCVLPRNLCEYFIVLLR